MDTKIPNVATNIINILVFHTPHIVWPREIDSSFHTFHSSLTASLLGYNMEIYYYHGYNKINLRPVSLWGETFCSLLITFYLLLVTFCSLVDKKFWRICVLVIFSFHLYFISIKSNNEALHVNLLTKKFNLWITWKLG